MVHSRDIKEVDENVKLDQSIPKSPDPWRWVLKSKHTSHWKRYRQGVGIHWGQLDSGTYHRMHY